MVKIVADTLTCISPGEAKSIGLYYIPQIVIFGEESYRDDSEIDAITFLKKLKAAQTLPKTAAPPPALYEPVFQEIYDQGHAAVVVAPSTQMSGTYRSATTAMQDFLAQHPDADIRVVDTNIIAGGLGAVVKQALRWANDGLDADAIVDGVTEMSNRHRVYFLVDTLEYLFRGGRIGAAKALFGSILQVKPILTLREGHTEPYESQRTHKRALARLKEIVLSDCPRDPEAHLCVMHGDAEALAKDVAADLGGMLGIPVGDIPIYDLTAAILTHSGPGALAISYFLAKGQES
jgi:DegV family protein with EDD domain